jgi:hypothetical protein
MSTLQEVTFDEAANADRRSPLLLLDGVQAEAQARVRLDRSLPDVVACVLESLHAPIPDEPEPGGIVDELEDELRVVGRKAPENQAIRLEDFSAHDPPAT